MKSLVLLSEESVFSGSIKCGIAEVVDSLATSLTENYDVTIVCLDGNGEAGRAAADFYEIEKGVNRTRFLKVNYFLIQPDLWPEKGIELINQFRFDIFHNFYLPKAIEELNYVPNCSIFTFDEEQMLYNNLDYLEQYKVVTTFSENFLKEILAKDQNNQLKKINLKVTSCGVLTDFFNPENGLLIPQSYSITSQDGKENCKRRLLNKIGTNLDKCVFLTACRLVEDKGIEDIIKIIPLFEKLNAILIVIGNGDKNYEEQLRKLSQESIDFIYMNTKLSPQQIPQIISGADFYLQPSRKESGGLMPMIASMYGAIPIVTQNGGLRDNFNSRNAIIVKNRDTRNALKEAMTLYKNKERLRDKRAISMSQNFSWHFHKNNFIKLYEGEN